MMRRLNPRRSPSHRTIPIHPPPPLDSLLSIPPSPHHLILLKRILLILNSLIPCPISLRGSSSGNQQRPPTLFLPMASSVPESPPQNRPQNPLPTHPPPSHMQNKPQNLHNPNNSQNTHLPSQHPPQRPLPQRKTGLAPLKLCLTRRGRGRRKRPGHVACRAEAAAVERGLDLLDCRGGVGFPEGEPFLREEAGGCCWLEEGGCEEGEEGCC